MEAGRTCDITTLNLSDQSMSAEQNPLTHNSLLVTSSSVRSNEMATAAATEQICRIYSVRSPRNSGNEHQAAWIKEPVLSHCRRRRSQLTIVPSFIDPSHVYYPQYQTTLSNLALLHSQVHRSGRPSRLRSNHLAIVIITIDTRPHRAERKPRRRPTWTTSMNQSNQSTMMSRGRRRRANLIVSQIISFDHMLSFSYLSL